MKPTFDRKISNFKNQSQVSRGSKTFGGNDLYLIRDSCSSAIKIQTFRYSLALETSKDTIKSILRPKKGAANLKHGEKYKKNMCVSKKRS